MESDRFDELTARLTTGLSRRRSVGMLGLLGLGGAVAPDAAAKKKKRKKKHKQGTTTPAPVCTPACGNRTCGDNGCGGSCGECTGDLVCRNGACGCPAGKELCGGQCYPVCVPPHPNQAVGRHPVTCNCCVRPGSYRCPDTTNQCCQGPQDLPCCARDCNPIAVNPTCPQGIDSPYGEDVCHYDVECQPGSRCPAGNDPRKCELIPG